MPQVGPATPEVRFELPGWAILWLELEVTGDSRAAAELLRGEIERIRQSGLQREEISQLPAIRELRRLFREAGCDPTRYRPASEALLRRVAKGQDIPSLHPLVDWNNALSLRLQVPCCVMATGTFRPPFTWRAGRPGEAYQSLRGPFALEGKPVLVDPEGPLDAPITGNERVAVRPDTRSAWLAAYLPVAAVGGDEAGAAARELASRCPGIAVRLLGVAAP
ncbi:MAG: hypothetical protein Kow00109_04190 [Acidobacteriota bacterium]